VGIIAWWLCGFGLAYGNPSKFIGVDGWYFASAGFEKMSTDYYLMWVYELVFALFTAVLFTGPLSERGHMATYVLFSFIIVGYIFPVLSAWVWGGGWLMDNGFHDYAGSGVIHMTAGVSGFWGAVILGERYGKDK
jgi:ammonium transporter, Amt family